MANNAEKPKVFIQGVQKSISSSYSNLGDLKVICAVCKKCHVLMYGVTSVVLSENIFHIHNFSFIFST